MADRLAWIAAALAAVLLGGAGTMKFVAHDHEAEAFARWGYPSWSVYAVGSAELTASLCMLWPRTASYGALLAMGLMVGAVATHLRVPEVGLIPLATVILALAGFVAKRRWPDRIGAPGRARDAPLG